MRNGHKMLNPATAPGTKKYFANCRRRWSAIFSKERRPPRATPENVSARHAAGTAFVKLAATESASETDAMRQPHFHSASAGLNSPRSANRAIKYILVARPAR